MWSSAWIVFSTLQIVAAITNQRNDITLDRRRQIPLGQPFFNDNRFGLSSPSPNFPQQNVPLVGNQNTPQYSQSIFRQQQTFASQPTIPSPSVYLNNQNPIIQNPGLAFPNQFSNGPFSQPANIQQFNGNSFQSPNIPINHQGQHLLQNTLPPTNNFVNPTPHFPPTQINDPQQQSTPPIFLPTIPPQQTRDLNANPSNGINPSFPISFHSGVPHNSLFTDGQSTPLQTIYDQNEEQLERLKELEERQKIIQKHKQFLERQQQKQQEKVEKLHDEFLSKQVKKQDQFVTTESYEELLKRTQNTPRPISPQEVELFQKAVDMFRELHPTTTTTTTTTTTEKPSTRFTPRPKPKPRNQPDQEKQKLYNEIRTLLEESETKGLDENARAKSIALLQKPDILKQLKLAIMENQGEIDEKSEFSSKEISLPNGQKIELIRTTNPNLIPNGALTADGSSLSHSVSPSPASYKNKLSFEDLTKGVLPPGADYELIKQSESGRLEEVDKFSQSIANKKKLTFVFLEEQNDGSYKVKGVKANGQEQNDGPEVENILQKIKNGEIQLPTPTKSTVSFATSTPLPGTPASVSTVKHISMSNHGTTGQSNYVRFITTPVSTQKHQPSTSRTTYSNNYSSKTTKYAQPTYTISNRTPTAADKNWVKNPTQTTYHTANTANTARTAGSTTRHIQYSTTETPTVSYKTTPVYNVVISSTNPSPTIEGADSELNYARQSSPTLVDILKENGLFATAKYLKQSGLDTILNETGPYTIFAPTDKAFRTLLVQLGGPDRAEEKFKDNPRLLSGLLLHHVIPGAFDIAALQDEMTGVSLAGTQLRVNQYDMHDVEWNEVKVTTINGARVVDEKKDISIPQGIAHAVDRVMFPLPVGDIVQTLQADRDRRFTTFLKAIYTSGFADTLSESKTYTVFAPTDTAFAKLSAAEAARLSERGAARALVAKHLMPGTLYSAGMRYYQLRNSMEDAKPLTLQKNAGRIKVNNAQVITHNIPATNGVIHAVDTLL